MNQNIARDIRRYIKNQVPVKDFDKLQPQLYKWMKRYWTKGLNHKERGKVRKIMKRNGSLPKSWNEYAERMKK